MMKTFKIFTLGCKVNQYETQAIRELLVASGFKETANGSVADIYVINSCTVTSKADSKSLELMRKSQAQNPQATVVLTGCLVHGDLKSLRQKIPQGIIVPNRLKDSLAQIIQHHRPATRRLGDFLQLRISDFKGHSRAFVKIQDGCNNTCTYCKIPLVRGKSRSRPLMEIKKEVEHLVKKGFQEIVLTGICLGDYGNDLCARGKSRIELSDLLEAIEGVEGVFRIRLSSIEAKDINDRLIDKIAQSERICSHLHIPFQSGDAEVLKRMQRNYRVKDYAQVVGKLRKKIPGVAITTDIMVGFPSESERNFTNTLKFVRRILPSRIHIFPFSPRPGTRAERLSGKIQEQMIKQREKRLSVLAKEITQDYYAGFLRRSLTVLVEHRRDKKSGLLTGYTQNYIPVLFSGSDQLMGRLVPVKICRVAEGLVLGRLDT